MTPYRPTVSTPAALSAPEWLEIEAGVVTSEGGHSGRREACPYTLKFAFTPDWGVRVQRESLVLGVGPGRRHTAGFGDTTPILKRRFAVNEYSVFGLEVGVGARGIDHVSCAARTPWNKRQLVGQMAPLKPKECG